MTKSIKMDASGRVVIPRPIREKYGLTGCSHRLDILESPEGIVLRPWVEEIPAERDASGWVVFRSGAQDSVDPNRAVAEERERRQAEIVDSGPRPADR